MASLSVHTNVKPPHLISIHKGSIGGLLERNIYIHTIQGKDVVSIISFIDNCIKLFNKFYIIYLFL